MRCEKCGYINPDENKFCGQCGEKIVNIQINKKEDQKTEKEVRFSVEQN